MIEKGTKFFPLLVGEGSVVFYTSTTSPTLGTNVFTL